MKKKVLYGAAVACFAFAAMGTLQSCKDELSDFKHQYAHDQFDMRGQIDALQALLDECKTNCATEIAKLKADILANKGDIELLKNQYAELAGKLGDYATIEDLNKAVTKLENDYKTYTDNQTSELGKQLRNEITQKITDVTTLISNLSNETQTKFGEVDKKLIEINNTLTEQGDSITYLGNKVTEANTNAQNALNQINEINKTLGELSSQVAGHESAISELTTNLGTLRQEYENAVSDLNNEVNELWNQVRSTTDLIGQVYAAINESLDTINGRIDDLDAKFAKLTDRLNDLLTSILVQGTDNPIFGNFSLPIGVKSNLAFDWYGKFVNDVDFPSPAKAYTYNKENPALTKEDLAYLQQIGLATEKEEAGFKVNGSLGKVYMTLNPIGHNLTDGKTFSLQTSSEKTLPFTLNAEECNDELSFGYSRSASNGFYSAEVMMEPTASNIDAVAVRIDDGLKEAAKDILHDRTKRNALNLLKAVYHQFDGMLPAYAMRADWTSGDNKYAVVSGYDIAVATARPLSYSFCLDKSIDHRLRPIGHIENLIERLINKDDFKIKINQKFVLEDFTITFSDLKFDFSKVDVSIKPEDRKPITITIPSIDVIQDGKPMGSTKETKVEVPASDLAGMYDAIEKGLKDAVENLGNNLNTQINAEIRTKLIKGIQDDVNSMLKNIEKQINDMLASLEKDINGQISDMIDNVVDKAEPYFARLNKVIDLYNKVAGKINNFLADPNHYLQVCAFYKGNGTVGILSNVKNDPTIFNNAGGNAISLFLSSYTAETVCPAYKKYAAVVNVYDANGNSVREAEKSNLQKMNAEGRGLNKVLTGRTFRVAVPAKYMKADYTYEIVYQGLDYSGVTSTQKFYIKVK